MRVDAYAHDVSRGYFEAMGEFHPSLSADQSEELGGFFDPERRIEHLDEHGIDRQIVALGHPHLWRGLDPEEALPLARRANDEIREITDEYPDRYIPVGTLPLMHEGMYEEFDRCIDDLDMAGVQIYTNYEGRPIDDEFFHPIYEKAEKADVPIWLHPQVHEWYDWTDQWGLHLTYGWLFDTTVALARLVFSGLMERYSDLTLIAHHSAAMIPHFAARTNRFYEDGVFSYDVFDDGYEELQKPVEEYFKQFYADTVMYGSVPGLRTAYEFFGPDHLLFGTDYPYGGDAGRDFMASNVRNLEQLDVPEEEKDRIWGENLLSLLDR